ncbi:hypothetical protein L6270_05205 [Candidatus Parcubacteria bacterium]|nr:hypothetical protein [Patescibacteria group bacterium]MBU4309357.1 hypothetical protein [Patescibacteria group bacterium]MBU4432363.1 hypothetical protein [Patescibacteria group bacterium]MBU4577718.1 hypothetical protein [Patescibacteria group bacterium]MCG2697404.1 hypothetical protein [Candidatus Parcubacteria bacterium]
MNHIGQDLFDFLRTRFPDVEDKIFDILIQASMKGRKIEEDFANLSQKTADELKVDFGRMDESDLHNWLSGLMRNKNGKYQQLFKDPMFGRIA